ncbi:MAG: 4-(cytidine 5'-diphospho)-2-C-methyl-D-erythritol kinase [Candidatus Omnitrophica bacterium]|nr:4-(cytidine 5'-diphospho)-2-C-methyl-D-erythritol kinase [Candidatus Omnitrophota bacterium]
MTSITLTAPAKVNLFLKILNKRKDGYHNLVTLFERISLFDTIKIKIGTHPNKGCVPKTNIIVTSDKPITCNQKDNLVYKAASLILNKGGVKSGVKIEIRKRIPIAAGLGGGSSDAAATLIGINRLFRLRLNNNTLINLAKELGADVPFFILDTPFAIGRGRGDELKKVNSRLRFWHLLIYPGFKVATKDVYKVFDDEFLPKCLTGRQGGAKITESMLCNDLEKAAIFKKRIIGNILKGLAQLLGKKAIVSGSGPSLFCLYRTGKEAKRAKEAVLSWMPERSRPGWQIFIVRTC